MAIARIEELARRVRSGTPTEMRSEGCSTPDQRSGSRASLFLDLLFPDIAVTVEHCYAYNCDRDIFPEIEQIIAVRFFSVFGVGRSFVPEAVQATGYLVIQDDLSNSGHLLLFVSRIPFSPASVKLLLSLLKILCFKGAVSRDAADSRPLVIDTGGGVLPNPVRNP